MVSHCIENQTDDDQIEQSLVRRFIGIEASHL